MKPINCILVFCMISIISYSQPKQGETTHYLFPEFTQGIILMKAGIKHDALLNYNTATEEMIFENEGKRMAISKKELELVDTVLIQDRKFIGLNGNFVEVVYHSKWDMYVEYKCNVTEPEKQSGYGGTSQTSSINSYTTFNVGGVFHKLKLPEGYELDPYVYYWLKKSGELNRFRSMRELKKLYKEKDQLFKAYVKKHEIKYDNQESIVQLIEYLESK